MVLTGALQAVRGRPVGDQESVDAITTAPNGWLRRRFATPEMKPATFLTDHMQQRRRKRHRHGEGESGIPGAGTTDPFAPFLATTPRLGQFGQVVETTVRQFLFSYKSTISVPLNDAFD